MGRANNGEDPLALELGVKLPIENQATGSFENLFLGDYLAHSKAGDKNTGDYLAAAIGAHIAEARRPEYEKPTRLESRKRLFVSESAAIRAVAGDPRFEDQLQVMIDLDSTLFPIDLALQELGLDIDDTTREAWGEDGDPLGDAIMLHFDRPDLLHGQELSEEQLREKGDICVGFFEELHGDEELMKRAGVFQYAPQLIKDMREQGIRVHIVTHRSPEVAEATKAWLEAMGIEYDDFVCDHSHNADKIEYCKERGIPVLLDDKPKTIRDAEAAGIEAVSLAWPYSKKALEEAGGDEAHCWEEMTHHTIRHVDRLVRERAKSLGVEVPDEIIPGPFSKMIKLF